MDKHAPEQSRKVSVRLESPWYTSDVKSSKRECRRAERKWRSTGLTVHKQIYEQALDDVACLIEDAKKQYYGDKIKSADQKSFFKLANSLMHKPKGLSLPLYQSATSLANKFNDFFVNKIVKIREDLKIIVTKFTTGDVKESQPSITENKPPELHTFKPTSEDEVRKMIMRTKSTQCSLDPIPTFLIKACLDALLPAITRIINLSMSEGVMPTCLKKALVIPLLKKVNLILEILKNFRPISNLSYLSKLIERIVAARITEHMVTNNLHELWQSSYKKFHSCETALIKVQNDILQAVDGKKCVLLVLLDLSAAFDTVDHEKLLETLAQRIGLAGTALKWFKNYLSDRIQSVIIDGIESNIWKMLFGVPQGSVLGPILFIIYTSPLGDIIRRHGLDFHLYADDTQLYLSFNIDETEMAFQKMEKCISEIRVWMANQFLCLNDNKTEVILIGSEHLLKNVESQNLVIGDESITPSPKARNIGAMFDETLSMQNHIAQMSKGAWYHLRQIGEIRPYLDTNSAKTLMHSFVSSRLDAYNGLLYGVPQQQLAKLQRIQNAAARIVARVKKSDHITPTLFDLHWLPINERIEYKILTLTYKAMHNMAPKYITDLLDIRDCTRTTRSSSQIVLNIPKSRTVRYGDRSFSYAAPYLWKQLPCDLKAAPSFDSFKSGLKTHLFKKAYHC